LQGTTLPPFDAQDFFLQRHLRGILDLVIAQSHHIKNKMFRPSRGPKVETFLTVWKLDGFRKGSHERNKKSFFKTSQKQSNGI